MKLSKGQGISLFTAIIIFAIFNLLVFLAPLTHTVVFWLGYFFELFALTVITLTVALYFGKSVKEDKFLSLPSIKAVWAYFVLQTILSVAEITFSPLPYLPVLAVNLITGVVFAAVILSLFAASGKIAKSEEYTAEKIIFIKELKLKLDNIETDDAELTKKLAELSEAVRFSDPMSHSKLSDVEGSLCDVIDELTDSIIDKERASELCRKASRLLKQRNELCKMYKGVKDSLAAHRQKSTNGTGIALAGVGVAFAMLLITLAVCFIIIPQSKYADAVTLMEAERYDEATVIFTELGNYRDSKLKIEEIEDILLKKKYDEALALFESEKYNEATDAFTKLGDYLDSKSKIEEIKTILLDRKYDEAEKLFNSGNYSKAINIYSSLGGYKDSTLRIEQICNRLSDGDIIYFGTYNNTPIAWEILKTESYKMLLITENPITQKPFNDEIKKVTWETSSLRSWLNNEFIASFSAEQQNQIILTETEDSVKDKVFLFSVDEMMELVYDGNTTFKTTDEWWTRTSSDDGIMYTSPSGWVRTEGDQVVRDKGIRPAIWINLK